MMYQNNQFIVINKLCLQTEQIIHPMLKQIKKFSEFIVKRLQALISSSNSTLSKMTKIKMQKERQVNITIICNIKLQSINSKKAPFQFQKKHFIVFLNQLFYHQQFTLNIKDLVPFLLLQLAYFFLLRLLIIMFILSMFFIMISHISNKNKKLKNSFQQQPFLQSLLTNQNNFYQLSLLHTSQPPHQQLNLYQPIKVFQNESINQYYHLHSIQSSRNQSQQIYNNQLTNRQKRSLRSKPSHQHNSKDKQKTIQVKHCHVPENRLKHSKDHTINLLQSKNQHITTQIDRIWQMIRVLHSPPKKQRQKIIQQQTNIQKLQKDLLNAYNHIKRLDQQIVQHQNKQKVISSLYDKMKFYDREIEERGKILSKLKREVVECNKAIKEGDRQICQVLSKRNIGCELENAMKEHGRFMEVVKQMQKREKRRNGMMSKKHQRIKLISRQLIESSQMSPQQLQDIKYKCIHGHRPKQLHQSVRQKHGELLQQWTTQKTQATSPKPNIQEYNENLKEIKLLQKLNREHQNNIKRMQSQKMQYKTKNVILRQNSDKLDDQIRQLQRQYEELRAHDIDNFKIRKHKLKTLEKIQIHSYRDHDNSSITDKLNNVKMKKNSLSQRKRFSTESSSSNTNRQILPVILLPLNINNNKKKNRQLLKTEIKTYIYGQRSNESIRFNDKYILDDKHHGIRIKELLVYYDPVNMVICGLKAIYQGDRIGGQYIWQQNKQSYQLKSIQRNNLFIKNISCHFDEVFNRNVLVGLEAQFQNKEKVVIGRSECQFVNKLKSSEYVSTMSGCMSTVNHGDRIFNVIEQLGFQIYSQPDDEKIVSKRE